MNTYTTEAARAHLGDIVNNAAAGISSIITYHGVPCALVIPMTPPSRVSDSDSGSSREGYGSSTPQ